MVQKTVSRKKERRICFFAVSCSLHASACDLAASLDSSWFAGQYPDGSFITSDKSLAPWEFLRGISDHVASFSFRKGSSNSRGVLGVVTPSAVFRSVIFGAFASRQQLFTFVVSSSVRPSASVYHSESHRAYFREISHSGFLFWLNVYENNEDLRAFMIFRHDWSL